MNRPAKSVGEGEQKMDMTHGIVGAGAPIEAAVKVSADPRHQYAALCYRKNRGKTEVLLVTSRDTGRWVIPKGWPMRDLPAPECAAREAWEEAGVEGKIDAAPLGNFSYVKMLTATEGVPCLVTVFPMKVTGLRRRFPERAERSRKWFDLAKAASKVAEPQLRALLAGFTPRNSKA